MKSIVLKSFEPLGINKLFRRTHLNDVVVLMYHGVVKDDWNNAGNNWLMVKESDFNKQMQHLTNYYHVIPLSEIDKINHTSKPRAVITFDDGYENNYTVAYPILKKFNLPATIFPVTNAISQKRLFWYDRLRLVYYDEMNEVNLQALIETFKDVHPRYIDATVDVYIQQNREYKAARRLCHSNIYSYNTYGSLSKEQIQEMHRSKLITFASHTLNHEILTHLKDKEVEDNIARSTSALKNIVPTIPYFCYPNGSYKDNFSIIVKKLGYKGAVTTTSDWFRPADYSLYTLPRYGIGRNLPLIQFAGLISGSWKAVAELVKPVKRLIVGA